MENTHILFYIPCLDSVFFILHSLHLLPCIQVQKESIFTETSTRDYSYRYRIQKIHRNYIHMWMYIYVWCLMYEHWVWTHCVISIHKHILYAYRIERRKAKTKIYTLKRIYTKMNHMCTVYRWKLQARFSHNKKRKSVDACVYKNSVEYIYIASQ